MEFSYRHRRQITIWLVVLFIILLADRWWNDMLLTQMQPYFFYTRMDVITWMFMYTGIHQWLLNNPTACILFDAIFALLPLGYLLLFLFKPQWSFGFAWWWVFFNFVYVQCFTLYPTNSIEGHIAWLLLPFLFTCSSLKTFYFVLHFMRYFFCWFLVSAGLWKLCQHGAFNPDEMSAIIYMQHKEYLVTSPHAWFSNFYYWLIKNSWYGYAMYVASVIIELTFLIGFFTRRFDRVLLALYILFFIMDVFVMRIKYWELVPFIVTMYYSKYKIPTYSKGSQASI